MWMTSPLDTMSGLSAGSMATHLSGTLVSALGLMPPLS